VHAFRPDTFEKLDFAKLAFLALTASGPTFLINLLLAYLYTQTSQPGISPRTIAHQLDMRKARNRRTVKEWESEAIKRHDNHLTAAMFVAAALSFLPLYVPLLATHARGAIVIGAVMEIGVLACACWIGYRDLTGSR
jgi:hypothetical protein